MRLRNCSIESSEEWSAALSATLPKLRIGVQQAPDVLYSSSSGSVGIARFSKDGPRKNNVVVKRYSSLRLIIAIKNPSGSSTEIKLGTTLKWPICHRLKTNSPVQWLNATSPIEDTVEGMCSVSIEQQRSKEEYSPICIVVRVEGQHKSQDFLQPGERILANMDHRRWCILTDVKDS
eukprot:scaffold9646_cov133-Cylindrotheca_fusiformis.AAC.2